MHSTPLHKHIPIQLINSLGPLSLAEQVTDRREGPSFVTWGQNLHLCIRPVRVGSGCTLKNHSWGRSTYPLSGWGESPDQCNSSPGQPATPGFSLYCNEPTSQSWCASQNYCKERKTNWTAPIGQASLRSALCWRRYAVLGTGYIHGRENLLLEHTWKATLLVAKWGQIPNSEHPRSH